MEIVSWHLLKAIGKWTLGLLAVVLIALVIWCLIPIKPTIAPITPRPDTQYWAMSTGSRIAYTRVTADSVSSKPPIIVLHGGPGGYIHSSTIQLLGALAELGHDVYFYDQIGSGRSDRLAKPKDYSFLGHVADLHEIITRQIRADKVILIGHSYGGQLTTQLTAMYPDLVDRLILSSPGELQPVIWENGVWVNELKYPCPESLRFIDVQQSAMDGLRFWTLRGLASMALATAFNVKLIPDAEGDGIMNTLASRFTANMVCDPSHVLPEEGGGGWYAHGWSNYYGDLEDPRPLIRKCRLPVLVLQGQCDYLPYESTYEYAALFPNACYEYIEGAGHLIWWDRPKEYKTLIAEFIQGNGQP